MIYSLQEAQFNQNLTDCNETQTDLYTKKQVRARYECCWHAQ
jgi:hypothetical protein